LELASLSQSFEGFWVAKKNGKIIGVLQLKEYPAFLFLSSLGVVKNQREHGIASTLIKESLKKQLKPVYLYTIIPDFFKKSGFEITIPPAFLPSKEAYECNYCQPDKCVCMVKYPHAA
jgi:N-acetylglutamate synthase-like GNAT family acetyltransferase